MHNPKQTFFETELGGGPAGDRFQINSTACKLSYTIIIYRIVTLTTHYKPFAVELDTLHSPPPPPKKVKNIRVRRNVLGKPWLSCMPTDTNAHTNSDILYARRK